MLLLAKERKVDFVLLGGDLFHENKPSRRTLYQTMDILRRHCMGDEPVSFQIISEQAHNFKDRFGHVNYEDPYFSVGLPIFSIHGNHDDPTREGGVEALAALDLLHVANLVNYFGKSNKVDDVEVNPILIQKGLTKVALYGMGSMRDERLNRMWQQKKVRFLRPLEDDGGKDFFNVFVLHQNRDLGRGKKNCIHESMIPEWIDLVIWGHEHECQVEPMESLVGTFRISQPGSSVATSLCEGEAVPKNVGLLEIRGNDFRLQAVPLSQVRPFRMGEIVLSEVDGLDSKGANVDEAVGEALANQVEQMVEELRKEDEELALTPPQGQEIEKRNQVLVRLKVEHSDFPTLNNQRFGSQFMGKVANPSDLLLFYRRRNAGGGAAGDSALGGGKSSRSGGLSDPIRPDNLADIRVEDLVTENLENADKKLSLLVEPKLKMALEDYVYKQDAQAVPDMVKEALEGTQKALRKERSAGTVGMIDDAISKRNEKERGELEAERVRNAERAKATAKRNAPASSTGEGNNNGRANNGPSDIDDEDDDMGMPSAPAAGGTSTRGGVGRSGGGGSSDQGGAGTGKGRRGAAAAAAAINADDEEEDDEEEEMVGTAAKRRDAGGRGRSAASQAAAICLADGSDKDDDVDDDDDDDFDQPRSKTPFNKRGGASSGGRGSRAAAPAQASTATSIRRRGAEAAAGAAQKPAPAGRRPSARGAGRARVSYREDDGDDSSELDEVAPARRRGGGGTDSFNPVEIDDDNDEGFVDDGDGDEASEFEVDDEEEAVGRGRGKKSKSKAAEAPPERAARSSRAAPATMSRGRKRPAAAAATSAGDSQVSEASSAVGGRGGAKKRRLPAWATASAGSSSRRGRDDDDDVEEVSSAISAWGSAR
ncbi:unnamed protein product [Ectocarpus sp. CCAP 1310/34]|nr:unnamed protein product [Ectocarpus sp. CCAP 1310/34]